jgi:hypothetical protein
LWGQKQVKTATPSEDGNPFSERVVSEYFVGREEELAVFEKNLLTLKNGKPNHFYIAGVEGTGKTAYLHKLAEIAHAKNFVGVLVSLDPVPAQHQIKSILSACIEAIGKQASREGEPPRRELMDDWDAGTTSKLFRIPRRDVLTTADAKHDFEVLAGHAKAAGRDGVVVCIDEGQRIESVALSTLKNSLNALGAFLVVLSLRLISDARGGVHEGRQQLDDRAQGAEGDIGASRFYVTGTAMGPFKTDGEVRRLFSARLQHNKINFSDLVAIRLGEISEKVPGRLINIAAHLYNRALGDQVTNVEASLLNDCFRDHFPDQTKLAIDLCANLSADETDLLKALCGFKEAAAAIDIVKHAYPSQADEVQTLIAKGAAHQLNRVSNLTPLLQAIDHKYKIANSIYRYALMLALRLA